MEMMLLISCSLLTIGLYIASRKIAMKYPSPLTTPNFICTVLLIVIFLIFGISVEDYKPTKEVLTFLLGPATVALAVPTYLNRHIFYRHWKAICLGIAAGTMASMVFAVITLTFFKLSYAFVASISVKSVTVPIALEISNVISGDVAMTTAFVIFTGIAGAMFGPLLLNVFKINDPVSRGLAFGTISHGVGTGQAAQESELSGAVAGVAMGITAVFTSFVAPFLF